MHSKCVLEIQQQVYTSARNLKKMKSILTNFKCKWHVNYNC